MTKMADFVENCSSVETIQTFIYSHFMPPHLVQLVSQVQFGQRREKHRTRPRLPLRITSSCTSFEDKKMGDWKKVDDRRGTKKSYIFTMKLKFKMRKVLR